MIPRLYDTTTGQVRVGGKDVRDYDIESLRDQVSVVLQKNVLFSGTIKENLRWGNPNASDEELVAACKLAQADEFVRASRMDMTPILNGRHQRLWWSETASLYRPRPVKETKNSDSG